MPLSKPLIEIVNVVASATIEQSLDLYKIQKKFPHVEYNPNQFPGAVFRISSPKTATLLFRTGKMVCTGAKSELMSRKAVKLVVQQLRKGGIKIKKDAVVTIQNIVSSINVILIFASGKLVCTGAKTEKDVYRSVNNLHSMLEEKGLMLYD